MSCCFSGVYRDKIPLVTCSMENGNWDRVFLNMCEHGQVAEGLQTLNINGFLWGILKEKDGLTFLIVCRGIDQKQTEDSLQKLKSQFIRANLSWKTAEQLSLMSIYEGKLSEFMRNVSVQGKIMKIQENIDDTNEQMTHAYKEVLLMGKKTEDLAQITSQLGTNSKMYLDETKHLRRALWWRKNRMYFFWALMSLVVLYILLVIGCGGFDLKPRCIPPKPEG